MSETKGSSSTQGIRLRIFGRTDVGQVREHNEDNFLVADLAAKQRGVHERSMDHVLAPGGALFGVCDGMGGAAAGEVASQLAVDIIFEKLSDGGAFKDRDELARRLVEAVEEAGFRIFNNARSERTHRGMGTTSTVGAMIDDRLFLAQVGDSRAYVLRGNDFVQVTRDQSLVNQLIEAGQLTEEEAETFEHNNIILQALGTSETVQVDLTYVDLRRGDKLLMCSDGLSGMVKADEMREVLLANADPSESCRILIERANQAGGHDNITVIVCEFGEPLLPADAPSEPLAYRKYPLPERPDRADTARPGSQPPGSLRPDEAQRDSKGLRVGHTMIGVISPLNDLLPMSSDRPAPRREPEQEPVDLPTTGFAPQLVGAIVLSALLLIATLGFFLLR